MSNYIPKFVYLVYGSLKSVLIEIFIICGLEFLRCTHRGKLRNTSNVLELHCVWAVVTKTTSLENYGAAQQRILHAY